MIGKYSKLRPKVILDKENENKYSKKRMISISKANPKGIIRYVNDEFSQISGYSKIELIGESHNIIRHPDMPKTIFKHLWKALDEGFNFHAVLKNLAKDGTYYWIVTDYSVDKNEQGEITGYTSKRRIAPKSVVEKIKPLYKILLDIEKTKGESFSDNYFKSYIVEEQEGEFETIREAYNNFVIKHFEESLETEAKEDRRKKVKKTLIRFFNSEYDS